MNRDLVVSQLHAAHDYRNTLTEIERGRRDAVRLVYETDEIREAADALKHATKSDFRARKKALYALRREAMEANQEEIQRINGLAADLQRGARELTHTFWGTYLDIESQAQQARADPLYGDDGLTPHAPRFVRWRDPMQGQLGVQIQRLTTTVDVLAGKCSYVRVERRDKGYATLWLRVGSDGRDPIWARWDIKMHREVPNAARWKWVRVSCVPRSFRDKPEYRETWTVEITVDDPAPDARSLDRTLSGAVAISWSWDAMPDESIRVASWRDTRGQVGEIVVPVSITKGIRKPDGIRAVRDLVWNDAQPKIARAIKESQDATPWLVEAANTMPYWKSLGRVHELARRYRVEGCTSAVAAYEMIHAFCDRDLHLADYERNARDEAIRERREMYRVLAAQWARTYRHVLLSDHDLSREARRGEDSDVRFTASPNQLRGALKNAFGADAIMATWDKEEGWCERACAAYFTAGARSEMFAQPKEKTTNAWASRKKKKQEKEAARKPDGNAAE
jgi:hypothetical protein